ncbi:MAG: UDP-3-O-(3-hydroxymyristoyl)glucosamine N-acyltransferase [Halanaerobiales bacterium]
MTVEGKKILYTAGELATMVEGELKGDPLLKIENVSGIEEGDSTAVTYARDKEKLKKAETSPAALVIVPREIEESSKDLLLVDNPRLAFARISQLFDPRPYYHPGIHPSSVIANTARLGNNISIHPRVVISGEAEIGDNVILGPGVYIGKRVKIGNNTLLHPGVVVEYNCEIGSGVIIQAGSVIGSDGYGYVPSAEGPVRMAQLGKVVIGDEVEIGASATVDRATSGATVIGKGTKIDNLVQIAHNVEIGENCMIVAQTGIAGSSRLDEEVALAGQVGIVDHVALSKGVKIGAKSLVTGDIEEGEFYSGIPARRHQQNLRKQALLGKLPALKKKIRQLEERIAQLEKEEGE